ncbi:hypothetical protein K6U70_00385 [Vibrio vulnificus]|uniref:hypothetical protein n=1 Tax=Vibrio vulnificus TaxID=672 RepID=UPI001EEB68CF|nr:hypothetical protein [Vibrio vulnificus]MCG6270677.1 hypothetical protein [Vibrio vulnificus]
MKDIIKSLKDNVTSRVRNPIVGAFALAWTALNINGVATFILADNALRLEIVKNKQWLVFDDLIYPMMLAILYLVILPILNLVYEYLNDGVINSLRNKHRNKNETEMFVLQKATVTAKVESDEEYIRKLKDKDIERWLEEKSQRNREFIALKERYAALSAHLSEKEAEYIASDKLLKEIHVKKVHEYETDYSNAVMYVADSARELSTLMENLSDHADLNSEVEAVYRDASKLADRMSKRFDMFDEDIPF